MIKKIIYVLQGFFIWDVLRLRLRIQNKKVVIILVNENKKLDYYAIMHLEDFVKRKCADEALILVDERRSYKMVRAVNPPIPVKIYWYPKDKIERLYEYYSFYKFSDRVVFTYTDNPKDNQLGRVLRETEIDEEDAVCLGLYHLRTIPKKDKVRRKRNYV